ncbi:M23 family metallopeptidase [Clostridium sp. BNL1100]|uniref:M23 family metallopeptidase n=1 Tax=Clostridium sp. BNL1100 TaxID=755731 RepID=UPI00024A7D76|nr:M23 family metallopeptidase [Clostridium sp. BNL1100]AEY64523.1 metalloendopeptidase-like membrane protein [Clostridium sp. BNL1100]
MHKFLIIIGRIKWLGLIGLIGVILGNPYLKLFWLVMLLGLIEIFYNLPVTFQSIKQVFSIPVTYISHDFCLPSPNNHNCKIEYILPFERECSVVNGGLDKSVSHSWYILPQRYAYDFSVIDQHGKSHTGDGKSVENYYCYGMNIISPADGEVVSVCDKYADSKVYADGTVDCSARDIRGNYIMLKHDGNQYSTIAHIMPKSILVAAGQKVKRGEIVARCGNSGNSSEPHIHFQIQDGKNFFASAGLPIHFSDITITENDNYKLYDSRPLNIEESRVPFADFNKAEIRSIHRGQTVKNHN